MQALVHQGHGNASRSTRRRPAKNSVSSNCSTGSTASTGSNQSGANGKNRSPPAPPSTPSPSHGSSTVSTKEDQKESPSTVLGMLRDSSNIHVHLASTSSLKTEAVQSFFGRKDCRVFGHNCDVLGLHNQPMAGETKLNNNSVHRACYERLQFVNKKRFVSKDRNDREFVVALESGIRPLSRELDDAHCQSYEEFVVAMVMSTTGLMGCGTASGKDGIVLNNDIVRELFRTHSTKLPGVAGSVKTYGEIFAKRSTCVPKPDPKTWMGKDVRMKQFAVALQNAWNDLIEVEREAAQFPKSFQYYDDRKFKPECPLFIDVLGIYHDGEQQVKFNKFLSKQLVYTGANRVVGIGSRGFITGAFVAASLGIGFVRADDPEKLPDADQVIYSHQTEYDKDVSRPKRKAISINPKVGVVPGDRVIVADDLLATSGSVWATEQCIGQLGGTVVARVAVTDIPPERDNARDKLQAPWISVVIPATYNSTDKTVTPSDIPEQHAALIQTKNKSVDTKSLGLVSNSLISADCNDTKKEEKDTKEESDSDEVQTPSSVRNDKVRLLQPSSTIVANEKKGVTSKVLTLSVLSSATPPQGRVKLIAGTCHPSLAANIAKHLNVPLTDVIMGTFANNEMRVEIQESCRACDIYAINPICNSHDGKRSVNDILMETLITISALKGASANRITADKKDRSRAAITARLVADMLEVAGVDRVITVDLHASQIQGFFTKPVDNLYAENTLVDHIKQLLHEAERRGVPLVIASPDAGGSKRCLRISNKLKVGFAIVDKERVKANHVESMRLVGDVRGAIVMLVDDMSDTCGTLILASKTMIHEGALEVHAGVIHGIFSGDALKKINECKELTSIVTTNTIPQEQNEKRCSKLKVLDVSMLLAEAIEKVHNGSSVSALFE